MKVYSLYVFEGVKRVYLQPIKNGVIKTGPYETRKKFYSRNTVYGFRSNRAELSGFILKIDEIPGKPLELPRE